MAPAAPTEQQGSGGGGGALLEETEVGQGIGERSGLSRDQWGIHGGPAL
jgi:hypothetical protein